jgi:hypothetical protein
MPPVTYHPLDSQGISIGNSSNSSDSKAAIMSITNLLFNVSMGSYYKLPETVKVQISDILFYS